MYGFTSHSDCDGLKLSVVKVAAITFLGQGEG